MLPSVFLSRLSQIISAQDLESVLTSFETAQVTAFRLNTHKAPNLPAFNFPVHSVDWQPNVFYVTEEHRTALLASSAFQNQQIYVQNLSSMLPPLLLNPQKTDQVLDLCAAPGSKTLQLSCLMENEGHIAAVEVVRNRFFKLQANLKAQGATNVRTFLKDGAWVWKNRPNHFDKVLVDAPCSTEARFRTNEPESYAYWSERKIKEMVHKQEKLLSSGIKCLKEGGELLYSTCSFAPEENEGVLSKVLFSFEGQIETIPIDLPFENVQQPLTAWRGKAFHPEVKHSRRILPTSQMESFFVAKIRKIAS